MLGVDHLPTWLYEALPKTYITSGALTIGVLQNALALVSGLILVSAGLLIWKMRRDYRRS